MLCFCSGIICVWFGELCVRLVSVLFSARGLVGSLSFQALAPMPTPAPPDAYETNTNQMRSIVVLQALAANIEPQ